MMKKPSKEDALINEALRLAAKQFTGQDAVNSFILQVLTAKERQVIGRRIAIARLILAGATYYEVREQLHISPNTFRNIRQWIGHELPAYSQIVTEHKNRELATIQPSTKRFKKRAAPFSFEYLKQHYPMHFLLFTLADDLLAKKEILRNTRKKKLK